MRMVRATRATTLLLCALVVLLCCTAIDGFVLWTKASRLQNHATCAIVPQATEGDDNIMVEDNGGQDQEAPWKKNARWNSLSPKVKLRIMQEAQDRAIANKTNRESSEDKKRKLLMFVKKTRDRKRRASRVKRDVSFEDRTPLAELQPGTNVTGRVISLTNFGAYVDVGTECDGLLHVSQMTRDFFVEHPRQVLAPGDEVVVTISSTNPDLKKLHLTMLRKEDWNHPNDNDDDDDEDRIPLEDLDVGDELWGEIKRVTAFGAYVELGATVDGFLHFMDHPQFGETPGAPPAQYMHVGDRVRVWVSDVDTAKNRIKLTANRPETLPGPRRDIY